MVDSNFAADAASQLVPPVLVQIDIAQLILMFPGPCLWLDHSGALKHVNLSGEALAGALLLDEAPELARMVQAVLQDGLPRQDHVALALDGQNKSLGKSTGDAQIFQLMILPIQQKETQQQSQPGILILGREVSLERNMLRALLASRQLFRDLVACSTDFAWETDRLGNFTFVSLGGALGFSSAELVGQSARRLAAQRADDASQWPFETQTPLESVEIWLKKNDGSLGCFSLAALPVTDAQGYWAGARGVARDITSARERDAALRQALARVRALSETDVLTGLFNRRAFMERLNRCLQQKQGGAILYMDLNQFKAINDTHGHAAGDALLKEFAALLNLGRRNQDFSARLGGDEFALWLDAADGSIAEKIARQLRERAPALAKAYAAEGEKFGVAIGIGVAPAGALLQADDILAQADAAMYRAKKDGKTA